MILYHFTTMAKAQAIKEQGLLRILTQTTLAP
jgi:hypothetical protein